MFVKDQQLCLNRSIYHKQIQDDSTRFESQTNNRLTCETWAQILVLSLFFEFLGLVWITTSNLGTSSVGNFLDSMRWECFRTNKTSKGVCSAERYGWMQTCIHLTIFISFFFSLLKATLYLDQKLNLLTVENSVAGFDFLKETFFVFVFQSDNSISCGGLKCLEIEWNKLFQSKTTTTANQLCMEIPLTDVISSFLLLTVISGKWCKIAMRMSAMTDNEHDVKSRFLNSYTKISNYSPVVHFRFTQTSVWLMVKSLY